MFLAICAALLFGAVVYALWIEPLRIHVAAYEVKSPDVPEEFDGTTILLVSDIHYGKWGSFDLREKITKIIQEEKPDLLLFGGDSIHRSKDDLGPLCESLRRTDAPLGKFGVPGNHDYLFSMEETMEKLESEAGIVSLTDRAVWITRGNARIRVVGTEFLWKSDFPLQFPYYELRDRNDDDFVLLLTHSPDVYERFAREERCKIDLVLSGHTHGGQITFFGFAPITKIKNTQYYSGRTDVFHPEN